MNIISLIDENITPTIQYFKLAKLLYQEIINYFRAFKIHTSQYSDRILKLQNDFENKLTSLKEQFKTVHDEHLFNYINIFPIIIKKHVSNYSSLINVIDLFLKDFVELMNNKINLIKNNIEQYNDSKKNFIIKCQEMENIKTSFFNNLSLTEDVISQYYTMKKIDKEDSLYQTKNDDLLTVKVDTIKKFEEKLNNQIKETKIIEKNYELSIESSKFLKTKIKENSEKLADLVRLSLNDVTEKYQKDIINILGILKISFQEPLSVLNTNLNKICQINLKNELEEIYKNFNNNNIASGNIFPSKYKLKTISLINNNNDNIFSMEAFKEEDLEKNTEKEEVSEINLMVIKIMYDNFKLISATKLDLKSEEEKVQTKKISNKLFLNIKNSNKARMIEASNKIFSIQDFNDLEKLINKFNNRYIFLQRLTRFRALKYDLPLKYFIIIGKLLYIILTIAEKEEDYFSVKNCIILSQTYYYKYLKEKIYLKIYIQNCPIFKKLNFWDRLLDIIINESENKSSANLAENAFGNMYTLINNMFEFGLNENEVKYIIQPKIEKYKLNNNYAKDLNELIQIKVENNAYIEENKKMEKYLNEILDIYNKECSEDKEENEQISNNIDWNLDSSEEKEKENEKANKNVKNNKKKVKLGPQICKKKEQSIWDFDEE